MAEKRGLMPTPRDHATRSTSHPSEVPHSRLQQGKAANTYPPGFEEDDRLRSAFIRELTLCQLQHPASPAPAPVDFEESIPSTLVRFWHDAANVPSDVRECLETWDALRDEGIAFRMFDDASASAYIAAHYGSRERTAFARCQHPAMRSDYLRMCFVLAEGGLYVDADDVLVSDGWRAIYGDRGLKVRPLCYDITAGGMVSSADIRRVDLPTDGRIFYVNNNPIAAPRGHPVLRRALARATEILLRSRSSPEIQSTTGPGNLTAALAAHGREYQVAGTRPDFDLLFDWEMTAEPRWDLAYRSDERNWRNWNGRDTRN